MAIINRPNTPKTLLENTGNAALLSGTTLCNETGIEKKQNQSTIISSFKLKLGFSIVLPKRTGSLI